jgi:hypothetical protein
MKRKSRIERIDLFLKEISAENKSFDYDESFAEYEAPTNDQDE